MTLISARGTDQRLHHEFHENRSTAKIRKQLNIEDTGMDVKYMHREELSIEEIRSLAGSSAETHGKCLTHDGPVPRTSRENDVDFFKHGVVFFPCDEECRAPTPGSLNSDAVKEGDKKRRPGLPNKDDETRLTSWLPRTQTQEEKMRERSRKGRERSLRTRRRNTARLKLLEENCFHLSRENNILRDLARSLAGQDDEKTAKLLNEYRLVKSEKPEPHKLMHPESYYMNLLSPLSITGSANAEDMHSNTQNVLEVLLPPEHSVIPQACGNANTRFKGKNGFAQQELKQEVISCTSKACSQVNLNDSKCGEKTDVSAIADSVFADPGYGDGKQCMFSLGEVCNQPLLSAEEIADLVEQGARAVDVPWL